MFKDYDCNLLPSMLENFPDVNRYKQYNNLTENYDACMFIPYGPKCYLWFTQINYDSKCILIDINKDRTLSNPTVTTLRFNNDLTTTNRGTILYCVKNDKTNIIVEDIIFYKGKFVNYTFKEKLQLFRDFFCKDYKQDFLNEYNISLAWIRNNANDEYISQKIPYDIYSTKYFSLKSNNCRIVLSKNDNTFNKIKHTFIIKKTDKCELYELYILNKDNKPIFYDYALINDLYNSKKLKLLFEENNELIYKCFYNRTYKAWVPDEIIKNKSVRISNVNELRKYQLNNF